jgi:hypothetical protein
LGGGGANCSLCPGCPMGKGRPCLYVLSLDDTETHASDAIYVKFHLFLRVRYETVELNDRV